MAKKIFINLPVADLKKAMECYTTIGFSNNPAFGDPDGNHWEVLYMDMSKFTG